MCTIMYMYTCLMCMYMHMYVYCTFSDDKKDLLVIDESKTQKTLILDVHVLYTCTCVHVILYTLYKHVHVHVPVQVIKNQVFYKTLTW